MSAKEAAAAAPSPLFPSSQFQPPDLCPQQQHLQQHPQSSQPQPQLSPPCHFSPFLYNGIVMRGMRFSLKERRRMFRQLRDSEFLVTERRNKVQLSVSIPGVKPTDLTVSIQRDNLTIAATLVEGSKKRPRQQQRKLKFMQSFTLDTHVLNKDKIEANLSGGVLIVSAPKLQHNTTTHYFPSHHNHQHQHSNEHHYNHGDNYNHFNNYPRHHHHGSGEKTEYDEDETRQQRSQHEHQHQHTPPPIPSSLFAELPSVSSSSSASGLQQYQRSLPATLPAIKSPPQQPQPLDSVLSPPTLDFFQEDCKVSSE